MTLSPFNSLLLLMLMLLLHVRLPLMKLIKKLFVWHSVRLHDCIRNTLATACGAEERHNPISIKSYNKPLLIFSKHGVNKLNRLSEKLNIEHHTEHVIPCTTFIYRLLCKQFVISVVTLFAQAIFIAIETKKRNVKIAISANITSEWRLFTRNDAGKWANLPTMAIHLKLSSISNTMQKQKQNQTINSPSHDAIYIWLIICFSFFAGKCLGEFSTSLYNRNDMNPRELQNKIAF